MNEGVAMSIFSKEKKSYNIWLAGLGTYAKSADKSKSIFNDLIEHGRAIESEMKERVHTTHIHTSVAIEDRAHQMVQKFVGIDNERLDRVNNKIDQLNANIETLLVRQQKK